MCKEEVFKIGLPKWPQYNGSVVKTKFLNFYNELTYMFYV